MTLTELIFVIPFISYKSTFHKQFDQAKFMIDKLLYFGNGVSGKQPQSEDLHYILIQ